MLHKTLFSHQLSKNTLKYTFCSWKKILGSINFHENICFNEISLCIFCMFFPNLYLMVRSGSGLYFNVNLRFSPFFIFSWYNINMLPSLIYKHLKTILIKHIAFLILPESAINIFSKSLASIFPRQNKIHTLKYLMSFHFPNMML